MAIGDEYRVRVCCYSTTLGQISLNNTYWLVGAQSGTGATAAQIATVLDNGFAPVYKALMPSVASYHGTQVQKINGTLGLAVASTANDGPGTNGSAILPAQDSGIIAWGTAIGGRHGIGRIYPGFLSINATNVNGQMLAGTQTLLQNIGNEYLLSATAGSGGNTSTLSLYLRSAQAAGVQFYPVITATARLKFATQRRRGQYGRLNPLPF